MSFYLKKLLVNVPNKNQEEFRLQKFKQNNIRILILASFLILEQSIYAFFIHQPSSVLQKLHLITIAFMFVFLSISVYFKATKVNKVTWGHQIYELSIGICGLLVAISRAALSPHQIFRLPTIYIAVLYGMAVIFYYSYLQSFVMYLLATILLIFILPNYQPQVQHSCYISDAISNGLIAWIVSMVNYYKYVEEFLNKKLIQKKNEQLVEKNEEIKQINQQLEELIIKDDLTKLYNRRKLDEVLQDLQSKADRYDEIFSLILLDLDHFKSVNDNFGHVTGDKVLTEFGKLLKNNVREVDICGRWGGEEFLVICPKTDLESSMKLARRLKSKIENHDFTKVGQVTSSLGIAVYQDQDTVESMLKRVDDCLYQAKANGRNTIVNQEEL